MCSSRCIVLVSQSPDIDGWRFFYPFTFSIWLLAIELWLVSLRVGSNWKSVVKYGATLMEVDVDGSISYPEPQVKDNGICFS